MKDQQFKAKDLLIFLVAAMICPWLSLFDYFRYDSLGCLIAFVINLVCLAVVILCYVLMRKQDKKEEQNKSVEDQPEEPKK